jgi:hypothetical protein
MNELKRLSQGNDRFVAELLEAARELDAPSPDAAGRIALAIACGGQLRPSIWRRAGFWAVVGGVAMLSAGVLTAAQLHFGHPSESSPSLLSPVASSLLVRAVEEPVSSRSQTTDPPLPCASSASAAPRAPAHPPFRSSVPAAPPKDEIALIDLARGAVRSGDSSGALRALAQHAAEFPKPRFGEEAAALRVEAVVLGGDRAAAERDGRRFLAAYPRSAYARRVRSAAAIDN